MVFAIHQYELAIGIYVSAQHPGTPPPTSLPTHRHFDDGHSDLYECYLIVVLICISLIIGNIEHLLSTGQLYVFFGEISI